MKHQNNMNKLDDFLGPAMALSLVTIMFGFLCYFAFLAQDEEFISRYPNENSNCHREKQIAGYCCKSEEQFKTGTCVN